jgi:transcription factor TFIIIB component B''
LPPFYNNFCFVASPNSSEKLQKRLRPFEVEEIAKESQVANVESTGNAILDDKLAEEDEMRMIEENAEKEGEKQSEEEDAEEEDADAMPVPQVRLGPDGEIILDEKSLVIVDYLDCKKKLYN